VQEKLPCKVINHVVGPRNGEGKENEKLKQAIKSVLKLAQQNNFKSISIPAISSGIFGFPKNECARILVQESINYSQRQDTYNAPPEIIEFCVFDDETLQHFRKEINQVKDGQKNITFLTLRYKPKFFSSC